MHCATTTRPAAMGWPTVVGRWSPQPVGWPGAVHPGYAEGNASSLPDSVPSVPERGQSEGAPTVEGSAAVLQGGALTTEAPATPEAAEPVDPRSSADPVAVEPGSAQSVGVQSVGVESVGVESASSEPVAVEVGASEPGRGPTVRPVTFPRLPAPTRTRVLTMANQKGGVGKTTSAVNVAAALGLSGLSVLVIDLDPQGNASTALGIDHREGAAGMYDVLVGDRPLAEIVQTCPDVAGLCVAPATIDLAGAEIELVSMVARETRLRSALRDYADYRERAGEQRLDYILIDCPPSLGLLTVNALAAAGEVFIPVQCEYYALEGVQLLLRNIELIRKHLNPDLVVSTMLMTMFDGRTRLAADVVAEVRTHFADIVLKALIPRSVRISEAPSNAETVMTYHPTSSGGLSYLAAATELAHQRMKDVQ